MAAAREVLRIGRSSLVGIINTAVGYGTIFGATVWGMSPYASNILGYALGLLCSFLLHRCWVFAAGGDPFHQLKRFLLAFGVAYSVNFAALHMLLRLDVAPLPAQFFAAVAYSICMYAVSRVWVFRS